MMVEQLKVMVRVVRCYVPSCLVFTYLLVFTENLHVAEVSVSTDNLRWAAGQVVQRGNTFSVSHLKHKKQTNCD